MVNKYYMSNGDRQLSPHFMLHEFQSKNGCNEILVDSELINMLETIIRISGATSATINDGYREPGEYCMSIGGSYADAHAYGLAADVVFYSEGSVISGKTICCIAQDIGVHGIGYMGNAVHLDTRGNGGYKNRHWWGDEITGRNISDWHDYFGISQRFAENQNNENNEIVIDEIKSENTDNNDVIAFDGGDMMNREISKEQLKYEVNRYALTVFGREIGDADTYTELLASGEIDWYEFNRRLQESEEGVKRWIKYTLFIDILGRIPEQSEIDWWYSQYQIHYEMNKALMTKRFAEDYDEFKEEYINKPL